MSKSLCSNHRKCPAPPQESSAKRYKAREGLRAYCCTAQIGKTPRWRRQQQVGGLAQKDEYDLRSHASVPKEFSLRELEHALQDSKGTRATTARKKRQLTSAPATAPFAAHGCVSKPNAPVLFHPNISRPCVGYSTRSYRQNKSRSHTHRVILSKAPPLSGKQQDGNKMWNKVV